MTGDVPTPAAAFLTDLTPRRFRTVLENSLAAASLAAAHGSARYRLDAHFEHVDYPSSSFIPLAVTVRSIVRYTLVDQTNGSVVFTTRADESAVVTRLQVPDEIPRANAAIRRSAQGNASRLVAALCDPNQVAQR